MPFKPSCGDKIPVVSFYGCCGIIIVNGWILWMTPLLISFIILITVLHPYVQLVTYIYIVNEDKSNFKAKLFGLFPFLNV